MNAPTDMLLAFDRSSRRPGWALFRGNLCLLEQTADVEPSRTPDWLAHMGQAIEGAGVRLAEISRFVAGLGPGSFSGTRASVAALQGLALPGRRPLLGVASAAAAAFAVLRARAEHGLTTPVAVVGDAHRERLWCALYALRDGHLAVLASGVARPPTHASGDFVLATWEHLPAALPADAWIITPDHERIGERLCAAVGTGRLAGASCLPSAADVGRLFRAEPGAACFDPLPIYLHPAVAQRPPMTPNGQT